MTAVEHAEEIIQRWLATGADPMQFRPILVAGVEKALREERMACANLAVNPYQDEVKALGNEEPLAVGGKIARAILNRSEHP